MITGRDIADARGRLKESQAAFAARFGVNQSTIDRWENDGVPSRPLVQKAIKQTLEKIKFPESAQ
jgi:DNA-binding transcriptional regulator YiaG